jgi:hypothetical protein
MIIRVINPSSEGAGDVLHVSQARSTCDAIADAINGVYSNARGATRTAWVHLSSTWDLWMTKNPTKLGVGIRVSYGVENVVENLRYAFDNSLSNIPAGDYAVIVDWPTDDEEGITMVGNKIYIHINPPTGGEK